MTTLHIRFVKLMNVLFLPCFFTASADKLKRDLIFHIEIQHEVGARNTKLFIFKILCPCDIVIPIVAVKLGKLVDFIGRNVTGRNHDAIGLFIKFLPMLDVGSVSIHRVKRGCRIGVHVVGLRAKFTRKIHTHEHGGVARVVGEGYDAHVLSLREKFICQNGGLRGFTRAVKTLDYNQFSHK